jgi:hypothetical protein
LIDGRSPFRFLVDTGAEGSIIPRRSDALFPHPGFDDRGN